MKKSDQITKNAAYEAVAPDDFASMIEVDRYEQRSSDFDKIISDTHAHFWDPLDTKYIDFSENFDVENKLLMPEEFLPENFNTYTIFENINEAIEKSSGLEILRVQKERIDSSENFNLDNFIKNFQLNKEKIDKASERLMILHPMPMNIGIEIDSYAAENFRMQHRKQLSFGISARKIALKYSLGLV